MNKTCSRCKEEKNVSCFSKNKRIKDGYYSYCKDCHYSYKKERVNKGCLCSRCKEKPMVYSNGYCKDCCSVVNRSRNYNLTEDQYNQMLVDQDYKCSICYIDLNNLDRYKIHIDHCHDSLKVRGILCKSCNLLLGYGKDNIDIFKSAIRYLNEETDMYLDREINSLISLSQIQDRSYCN